MSEVLILFESGSVASVRAALYKAPGERSRLLDAYVTTECEGAVTRSARRAAEAVLNWLPENLRPAAPRVAGFDLAELPAGQTLSGESAGLAFAVALAAELTGLPTDPLAATGILASGRADTAVLPVKGINHKLRAAIQQLPPGGKILYPGKNRSEITGDVCAAARLKGVELLEIARIDEALGLVFGQRVAPVQKVPRPHGPRPGLIAALAVIAATVGLFFFQETESVQGKLDELTTPVQKVSATVDAGTLVSTVKNNVTFTTRTPLEKAIADDLADLLAEHFQEKGSLQAVLTIKDAPGTDDRQAFDVSLEEISPTMEPVRLGISHEEAKSISLISERLYQMVTANLKTTLEKVAVPTEKVSERLKPGEPGKGFD